MSQALDAYALPYTSDEEGGEDYDDCYATEYSEDDDPGHRPSHRGMRGGGKGAMTPNMAEDEEGMPSLDSMGKGGGC